MKQKKMYVYTVGMFTGKHWHKNFGILASGDDNARMICKEHAELIPKGSHLKLLSRNGIDVIGRFTGKL